MERFVLKPTTKSVTKYKTINDKMAVAIKPLYKAPMIELFLPSLTK